MRGGRGRAGAGDGAGVPAWALKGAGVGVFIERRGKNLRPSWHCDALV